MTVGVAGVPGGSRLNISTPDNPRGRMSRQHGRRPSSYQRPYVYTSPCSTTLVSQERCSKTMGIVLPGVLRFWIHIYLDIYTRTCIFPFLSESRFDAIRKNPPTIYFHRETMVDCHTIFFLFLRVARLRSRVTNKYNRGESLVKKARRKNLHYYPRERFR